MQTQENSMFRYFPQDFLASVVVFLVALPLCMGISIASGVPPALGLITGIVGGLVVGFLAGSPLQVSGPAAGLAVIVWEIIQKFGLPALGIIVLLAGVIQLAAGLIKGGQWFRMVPPSVIYGMLAGIGVLIFSSQFHVMVDDKPREHGLENFLSIPEAIYKGVFPMDGSTHHLAAFIGILTIVSIISWNRYRPKFLKAIPGALMGIVVAVAYTSVFKLPIKYVTVPSSLLDSVTLPTADTLNLLTNTDILFTAVAVAIVASAETLLCATAVDQMTPDSRTNYDKELAAQGVGNIICGFLGALPMTGVIVRSSANVESGGKTRKSAILHGVWLLALVGLVPFVLELIPTASLAAILVYTGYKLFNIQNIKKLIPYGRNELAIYASTVFFIVSLDLLKGVMIGLAMALFKIIYTFTHLQIETKLSEDKEILHLHLEGSATFISLPKLANSLENLPFTKEAHIYFQKLDYIDHACLELIFHWEKQHSHMGTKVHLEWDNLVQKYHSKKRNNTNGTTNQSNAEQHLILTGKEG